MTLEKMLEITGFKVGSLLAGFAGSIASLVANKQLTYWQSIGTIVCGLLTSGYITPAIGEYFDYSQTVENMIAFLIGLLGMFIVVGLIQFGQDFAKAPIQAIKNLLSLRYFITQQKKDPDGTQPKTDA